MKIHAAARLHATLITESRVVLRAVIDYLQRNGHGAQYTDDDCDMVVTNAAMDDVVDTLDAKRWNVEDRHVIEGGLYTHGIAVIMTGGPIDLKLMQTSLGRVVICQRK